MLCATCTRKSVRTETRTSASARLLSFLNRQTGFLPACDAALNYKQPDVGQVFHGLGGHTCAASTMAHQKDFGCQRRLLRIGLDLAEWNQRAALDAHGLPFLRLAHIHHR